MALTYPLGRRDLKFRVPSAARMYSCYLGAWKDTSKADREAAEQVIGAAPDTPAVARENLLFAGRAATWAVNTHRIDQVLDIGVGILDEVPLDTVEQCVRKANAHARVIAFDNDPVVLARARVLRPGYGGVLEGDVTDLDTILAHPQLPGLGIDLSAPMVVVLTDVLHFVSNPTAVTLGLAERLAPGSVLVMSHACSTNVDPAVIDTITTAYRPASSQIFFRTEDEIRALVQGNAWTLVTPPGLVDVARWGLPTPHHGPPGHSLRLLALTAVLR